MEKQDGQSKVAILLHRMRSKVKIFDTFNVAGDSIKYEELVKHVDYYFYLK